MVGLSSDQNVPPISVNNMIVMGFTLTSVFVGTRAQLKELMQLVSDGKVE